MDQAVRDGFGAHSSGLGDWQVREGARRDTFAGLAIAIRGETETCWFHPDAEGDNGYVLEAEQASLTPSEFQSRRSHLPLLEKGRLRVDSNTRSRSSILGPQIACQTSFTAAHFVCKICSRKIRKANEPLGEIDQMTSLKRNA